MSKPVMVQPNFTFSEAIGLQQLLDSAVKREGLAVAEMALTLNRKLTAAVQFARMQQEQQQSEQPQDKPEGQTDEAAPGS